MSSSQATGVLVGSGGGEHRVAAAHAVGAVPRWEGRKAGTHRTRVGGTATVLRRKGKKESRGAEPDTMYITCYLLGLLHRHPGGAATDVYFLTVWRLESPRSRSRWGRCLARALLTVSLRAGEQGGSSSSCKEEGPPPRPPFNLNDLRAPLSPGAVTLGVRVTYELGGGTRFGP